MNRRVEGGPSARTATERLARFVTDGGAALPAEVVALLKRHILDTLGCQLAFADLPWSRTVWRYAAQDTSGGPATISHFGTQAPVPLAAFANAAFAHGFEMDDTEMRTASHPGAVVVPAALAAGQAAHSSGAELLTAVAMGYETMVRIGLASVAMMRRGFHTTAVTGPFGAAAAVASLWSADEKQVAHALGIAASRASGVTEYSVSGGSVKRVHAGIAAQAGVESVSLAMAGVTAPSAALEGRRGLLQALSDTVDPDAITAGLGQRYELLTTGLKPYCCCAAQHSVLDAVADLQRRHHLTADSIRRLQVMQNRREVDVVGTGPEPTDVTSAQFNAAFGIALRLVRGGNGFGDYLGCRVDDERLLAMARKVEYRTAPEHAPLPGDGPCEVRVELHSGEVVTTSVSHATGTAANPLGDEAVIEKFHDLADGYLGRSRATDLVDLVTHLETVDDVDALARLLVVTPGHAVGPRTSAGATGSANAEARRSGRRCED